MTSSTRGLRSVGHAQPELVLGVGVVTERREVDPAPLRDDESPRGQRVRVAEARPARRAMLARIPDVRAYNGLVRDGGCRFVPLLTTQFVVKTWSRSSEWWQITKAQVADDLGLCQ